ncbi:MAG: hypothetical protein ACI8XG_000178 [Congregibacter sp.]|jgi:hypothetical protein
MPPDTKAKGVSTSKQIKVNKISLAMIMANEVIIKVKTPPLTLSLTLFFK